MYKLAVTVKTAAEGFGPAALHETNFKTSEDVHVYANVNESFRLTQNAINVGVHQFRIIHNSKPMMVCCTINDEYRIRFCAVFRDWSETSKWCYYMYNAIYTSIHTIHFVLRFSCK